MCPHLRSLGLYYCQNITDRAMYSLAHSCIKNKPTKWGTGKGKNDDDGLRTLNISQCTALTPPAVQAVCDSFPALHTCSGRHSLIMSGCLNLMSVHCACAVQAHRASTAFPHSAHWTREPVYFKLLLFSSTTLFREITMWLYMYMFLGRTGSWIWTYEDFVLQCPLGLSPFHV